MAQGQEFINDLQSQAGGLVLFGAAEKKRLVLLTEVKMLAEWAVITVLDGERLVSYCPRSSEVEFLKAGPAEDQGALCQPRGPISDSPAGVSSDV